MLLKWEHEFRKTHITRSTFIWKELWSVWFPAQLCAEAPLRFQGVPAGSWLQEPEAFTLHITQFDQWIQLDLWVSGEDQSVRSNLFRYSFFHTLLVKSQVLKTEGPSLPPFILRETMERFYCCLQPLWRVREERDRIFWKEHSDLRLKAAELLQCRRKKNKQGLFLKQWSG